MIHSRFSYVASPRQFRFLAVNGEPAQDISIGSAVLLPAEADSVNSAPQVLTLWSSLPLFASLAYIFVFCSVIEVVVGIQISAKLLETYGKLLPLHNDDVLTSCTPVYSLNTIRLAVGNVCRSSAVWGCFVEISAGKELSQLLRV